MRKIFFLLILSSHIYSLEFSLGTSVGATYLSVVNIENSTFQLPFNIGPQINLEIDIRKINFFLRNFEFGLFFSYNKVFTKNTGIYSFSAYDFPISFDYILGQGYYTYKLGFFLGMSIGMLDNSLTQEKVMNELLISGIRLKIELAKYFPNIFSLSFVQKNYLEFEILKMQPVLFSGMSVLISAGYIWR